ncbi:MAG: imidazole glycerol phosphate synthase subunit HisH [Armatimonadetes bacterium CG07_land_8_20_14_0_80_40_9]|nr:MAG: imidazole glycerol phosphate synthase subunit HisH [Armatimonadetes bacterium CG07_land_8_20_14_0_80_40_9]
MIAIIDYGMGNLRSVQKGFEKVGFKAIVTSNPKEVLRCSKVVLPGVGAFKDCMKNLKKYRLLDSIYKSIESGKPYLGICLGLQILFSESEEFGIQRGLDIIKGRVVRFPKNLVSAEFNSQSSNRLKIPHMGWNNIKIVISHQSSVTIFNGIPDNSFFYFVHSYYVIPEDKGVIATTTNYGIEFTSSIAKDNIFACQFHPEKSQELGLRILKNFGKMK